MTGEDIKKVGTVARQEALRVVTQGVGATVLHVAEQRGHRNSTLWGGGCAGTGAVVGSFFGPVGIPLGAFVGGVIGAVIGSKKDRDQQASKPS
ncbi:MAG: hypothetical protein Q8S73_20675 [Deltaproteobacteria bacterium]|nr:hypothetical protein [Deltaproteobacteria bacterium]